MNCFSKKKKEHESEMQNLQKKTRFSQQELNELFKRFNRMSEGNPWLSKSQFRENMGLLGLDSVYFLADRLFAILDDDQNGRINFDEFAAYFDKITNGDQLEKSEISYKLIDQQRNGFFTLSDFQSTMQGLIQSWVVMTGQPLTQEVKEHLDSRIIYIFRQMDTNQDLKISLKEYQCSVLKDPSLLDIFEFLKKGVTVTIQEAAVKKEELMLADLNQIQFRITDLYDHLMRGQSTSKLHIPYLRPSLMSSLVNQTKNLKQMSNINVLQNSNIGIQYLFGEDTYIPSAKTIQVPIIQVNSHPAFKSDMNVKHQLEESITLKNEFFLEERPQVNELDEMLERIKVLTDSQIRENYREMIIKLFDINKCLFNTIIKFQDTLTKKQSELHDKQKDEIVRNERLKQTIMNVHKRTVQNQQNRRSNLSVQFGHQNWNLVLNMMIGLQMAVKSVNSVDDYDVSQRDFKLKYYFELLPRRATNNLNLKVCKFYDYAPQVFNQIRKLYMIDSDSYLGSIGPETILSSILKGDLNTLSELTSTGKSGSFFYYSQDGQFTLKTICKDEFTFLKHILVNYFHHLKTNPKTLIIRLFGMHKIILDDKKQYFVIMSNVFKSYHEIHQRYDIKGSLYNRTTPPQCDQAVARKDEDFLKLGQLIHIQPDKYNQLLSQIQKDAMFFAQNNIIDYSLLVGIHNDSKIKSSAHSQRFQSMLDYEDDIQAIRSIEDDKIYFFGIIDILTQFKQNFKSISIKKKAEFCCKRIFQGPTISAIPPDQYADRFVNFISQMFVYESARSI
ncbi:hypothetical protein pb186bvf_013899 [Paramecium bursaria]